MDSIISNNKWIFKGKITCIEGCTMNGIGVLSRKDHTFHTAVKTLEIRVPKSMLKKIKEKCLLEGHLVISKDYAYFVAEVKLLAI